MSTKLWTTGKVWISAFGYDKNSCVNIVQQLYYTHFYLPLLSLANFHVPAKDNVFDDVIFTEIYGQAANKIIQQYKDDALGLPSFPQNKRPRYDRYDRPHSGTPGRFGPPRLAGFQQGFLTALSHSLLKKSP